MVTAAATEIFERLGTPSGAPRGSGAGIMGPRERPREGFGDAVPKVIFDN